MLSQGKLLRNVLILNMDKQLEDISVTMYEKKIEDLNSEELFIVVVFMVKRFCFSSFLLLQEKISDVHKIIYLFRQIFQS